MFVSLCYKKTSLSCFAYINYTAIEISSSNLIFRDINSQFYIDIAQHR